MASEACFWCKQGLANLSATICNTVCMQERMQVFFCRLDKRENTTCEAASNEGRTQQNINMCMQQRSMVNPDQQQTQDQREEQAVGMHKTITRYPSGSPFTGTREFVVPRTNGGAAFANDFNTGCRRGEMVGRTLLHEPTTNPLV